MLDFWEIGSDSKLTTEKRSLFVSVLALILAIGTAYLSNEQTEDANETAFLALKEARQANRLVEEIFKAERRLNLRKTLYSNECSALPKNALTNRLCADSLIEFVNLEHQRIRLTWPKSEKPLPEDPCMWDRDKFKVKRADLPNLYQVRLTRIDLDDFFSKPGNTLCSVNFRDAVFEDVSFIEGKFDYANFDGARFRGGRFDRSTFTKAIMEGVKFVEPPSDYKHTHTSAPKFTNVNLTGADLKNAFFCRVNKDFSINSGNPSILNARYATKEKLKFEKIFANYPDAKSATALTPAEELSCIEKR